MSDVETVIDPFAPAALDEETELRALVQALRLAQGFKLIFVRCNQPEQRQRLIAEVRRRLPEMNVQEIHLSEPVPHLLEALNDPATQKRIADQGLDSPSRDQQTPEALAAYQKAEIEKWWPIVKAANIKAQ